MIVCCFFYFVEDFKLVGIMSVQPIIPSINTKNNNVQKIKPAAIPASSGKDGQKVSFTGSNMIVSLMDFIEAGGYPASFIIQDGLGFITPRVGKGLVRGGKKKKDENGNDILDENGNPKRELNWAYARKEGLREVITGPSAFVIPLVMLKYIKKHFGAGNNVKLNYIDSLSSQFTKFAKQNTEAIKSGNVDKSAFYKNVFADIIEDTINASPKMTAAGRMSKEEVEKTAQSFAQRQIQVENILSDNSIKGKKAKAARIKEIGGTVEEAFMNLQKNKIGGTVNEMAVAIRSSKGELKGGSISELTNAMQDFFGDAVENVGKALKKDTTSNIENVIKHFANKRMGTRILTNLGLFGTVAAFYTQIPKLYNMGTHGKNPAFADEEDASSVKTAVQNNNSQLNGENKKDIPFTGNWAGFLEKTGEKIFNGKHSKSISDIFEFNGPIISGTAMPVLLYGFCIPPRLSHAQDKYDYGEIVVRDMTAFTALLFGAKALARLFSDGFTKITGLALNNKNMQGRNIFQKAIDYLNPNDTRHSVLSSKQLNSKYTNIKDYKDGVNGFMDFIEQSGGNIKKAFASDKQIKQTVEEIVQNVKGKSYKEATAAEIRDALKIADKNKNELIEKFYKLFDSNNGLLKKAKTCNSTFGFLSTLVLVPGLIIWLTDFCEKMTANRKTKEKEVQGADAQPVKKIDVRQATASAVPMNAPSMAGFLKK